jgi:CO dehydrogenase maturation factor
MMVMGHTDTLGCYCPVNGLLRRTIPSLAGNFDAVIIDAEAGIEQVNRQVVESVQYPVIVSDNSLRGVRTALLIHERIREIPAMRPGQTGVIFNRVDRVDPGHVAMITAAGMHDYLNIPPDDDIVDFDRRGASLLEMDPQGRAPQRLRDILSSQGIL